ncbi:peptide MFS transporter [Burkholderia ubonensis]|uniref:peptide MFS transporter n=1 Tax=Burkholderia ubonensis TaxID=101571 RepID=UPI0009B4123E|nr:peptide MFS transporter [Burkholderia ubonensis]
MTTTSDSVTVQPLRDTAGLAGHPRGLTTLFFTEMWERFSFYGMRAILVLYMVAAPGLGGLGYDTPHATAIYGTYSMAAFLLSLPGGIIADQWLGTRRSVLIGGIIIAAGHFTMAIPAVPTFFAGLVLVACGTGLLKPNVSALVGGLYSQDDDRRDSGFSLFYMGINIGAFLAPLVCGFLAEAEPFKNVLRSFGIDPVNSWHFGFAAAGVGMLLGLVVFWFQRGRLEHVGDRLAAKPTASTRKRQDGARQTAAYVALGVFTVAGTGLAGSNWQNVLPFLLAFDALVLVIMMGIREQLTGAEWKRLAVMGIYFVVTIAFWSAYEQKGSSLSLFAKEMVERNIGSFVVPAAWFQSLTALYVILLAPVFAALWVRLGRRQPSSLAKLAIAPLLIGFGYAAFAILCSTLHVGAKINPLWLAGLFLFEVFGELCLSPIGLNLVTKLAPVKLVGLMMGLWFFGSSFGYKLAGYFAGFYVPDPARLTMLYGSIAAGLFAVAALLFLMMPMMRKLVGDESAKAATHTH